MYALKAWPSREKRRRKDISVEQAGAELGQAQLKLELELGFTKFKIDLVFFVWFGLCVSIDLVW